MQSKRVHCRIFLLCWLGWQRKFEDAASRDRNAGTTKPKMLSHSHFAFPFHFSVSWWFSATRPKCSSLPSAGPLTSTRVHIQGETCTWAYTIEICECSVHCKISSEKPVTAVTETKTAFIICFIVQAQTCLEACTVYTKALCKSVFRQTFSLHTTVHWTPFTMSCLIYNLNI